jgi:GT2 family glycosyltransferase
MISIVIPNYNGTELLRRNLPGVLEAARREVSAEVIVVDDASSDRSVELLREEFASVRVIANPRNLGFGRTCMAGALAAKGDILVLLNSDVSVEPDFLAPLREDLEDGEVFAVSAVDLLSGVPDAPCEVRHPKIRRGFFRFYTHAPVGKPPYDTLFVPGGYAAYRRSMFLELGGFEPLYEPFYWEDVDICYRAWKRGWRSVVDPRSRIRHEHEQGSILTTQGRARARAIDKRNRFLFLWRNVTSARMFIRHLISMALRFGLEWASLDLTFHRALLRALPKLGEALKGRRRDTACQLLEDREVFAKLVPTAPG